jgi:hypothetical protein
VVSVADGSRKAGLFGKLVRPSMHAAFLRRRQAVPYLTSCNLPRRCMWQQQGIDR